MKCLKCGRTIKETKCGYCGFDCTKDSILTGCSLKEYFKTKKQTCEKAKQEQLFTFDNQTDTFFYIGLSLYLLFKLWIFYSWPMETYGLDNWKMSGIMLGIILCYFGDAFLVFIPVGENEAVDDYHRSGPVIVLFLYDIFLILWWGGTAMAILDNEVFPGQGTPYFMKFMVVTLIVSVLSLLFNFFHIRKYHKRVAEALKSSKLCGIRTINALLNIIVLIVTGLKLINVTGLANIDLF